MSNADPIISTDERWTLHQGDALAWLDTLPDASVDAVITDPPYSSGGRSITARKQATTRKYVGKSQRQYPEFEGDARDQRSWQKWMTLWLSQALRVARPGAPIYLFSDWRQLPSTSDALQMAGWIWRGTVAWDKTASARPMLGRFRQQAEFIVWGSKGAMARDRRCNFESNVLPGVLRHRVKAKDKHHVTGKWVFPSPSTGKRYAYWPERKFQRAQKAAGLSGGVHTLRHTYASHFLQKQPDLFLLARVLGHSDVAVTKLYSHLLPGHLARARNAVHFEPRVVPEIASGTLPAHPGGPVAAKSLEAGP